MGINESKMGIKCAKNGDNEQEMGINAPKMGIMQGKWES